MTGYFGNGDYGYGLYGVATPQTLTGVRGGIVIGGATRVVPRPQFHPVPAQFRLAGGVALANIEAFHALAGAMYFRGAEFADLWNILHTPAGGFDFDGWAYMNEQVSDRETVRLVNGCIRLSGVSDPVALFAAMARGGLDLDGSARPVPLVALHNPRGRPEIGGNLGFIVTQPITVAGPMRLDGATGRFVVGVAYRAPRGRIGIPGRVSGQIWAVQRAPRGQISLLGAGRAVLALKFRASVGAFIPAGRVRTSYGWSDETAPGRYPVPPWGITPVPGGDWQAPPAVTEDWAEAATVAPDPWQEAVGASDDWQEI